MNSKQGKLETMFWRDESLYILDQRLLPQKKEYIACRSAAEVGEAICNMSVRGAPAIGIAAAFGMALAARQGANLDLAPDEYRNYLRQSAEKLGRTRPTAVNLTWALDRIEKWLRGHQNASREEIAEGLRIEASQILAEDVKINRRMGQNGATLVPGKAAILTHCNAGALATGGYGTALGVIRAAVEQGKKIHVYIDETRPLLQGARLTAFEMREEGIEFTLVTDNCAGYLMSLQKIDLIIVGADRIAANGDTANKIGTYSLAVLAGYHGIPFYIAAPISTIDQTIEKGEDIAIEERNPEEVTSFNGLPAAPDGVTALNPAFDVTPAPLITALITERGVVEKPDRKKICALLSATGNNGKGGTGKGA
ncbi:MAG TPA: S-methyl-5-thioribose-1-phosphate isomerase [Firmicutes bacterium]|nr:S-methyl-5-thioribose-1-phosphate isomerase [Bacillota bacterium]